MSLIETLTTALMQRCPIDGVSIGHWEDRRTWRLSPTPAATSEQVAAAEAYLAAFDPATVPPDPDVKAFEGALKVLFANNLLALNTLMAKYPLFLWSLRDENWSYVEQMLIGAHGTGDLSDATYDAIKTLAAEKYIPVTL